MEGRIAHLRSHYRLVGTRVAAPAVVSRLDRVLREEVMRSYGEALESALAGDDSVYVLRRVKVRANIVLDADTTDEQLAKKWGQHLAATVMRAIARGEDDAGNLVRFENQADYVASFLVALLKREEQRHWFYGKFAELQTLDKKTAIRRVLLENISHVPAILAYVHRYGEIDSLIATLDAETKQALWWPESEQRDDLEISRSLFTTAAQFVQKLGSWTGPPPQDGDEMFRRYWESGPPFSDWRDPRSLAESVLEVVRYFFARGYLASSQDVATVSLRLGEALEDFEWLDRDWLRSSVLELFDRRNHAPSITPDLPLRVSTGRATPRQRELLAAIAGAVDDANLAGNDPLAASLKILALLVDAAPGWAEDSAAKVMIENLVAVGTAVPDQRARAEFLARLRRRDVEGAVCLLPLAARESVRDACRAVAALGEPALELLEKLAQTEAKPLTGGIESECAGLALLFRPMLDARLHALSDEEAFPSAGEWPPVVMLFVLVAHRIVGDVAFIDGRLEPGLCLLTGMEPAPRLDDLRAVWREAEAADYSNFHNAVLRIAAGHRLDFLDLEETNSPNLDRTIAAVTCLLLRMWARWLRGFSDSSQEFLIDSFFRRPGRIYAAKDFLLVELDQRPLDVVMEMAGYLADLELVPWLPGKRIKFSLKES